MTPVKYKCDIQIYSVFNNGENLGKYICLIPQRDWVSKRLIYFVYNTQLMVGKLPKGMLAKHYIYSIHNTPVDQQQEDRH